MVSGCGNSVASGRYLAELAKLAGSQRAHGVQASCGSQPLAAAAELWPGSQPPWVNLPAGSRPAWVSARTDTAASVVL